MRNLITFCLIVLFAISLWALGAQSRSQSRSHETSTPAAVADPPTDNIVVYIGPIPQKITDTSAEIWWVTSVPSSGTMLYGTAADQENSQSPLPLSTGHAPTLKNLEPQTTYYFRILRPDQTERARGQFTTRPSDYRELKQIQVNNGPAIDDLTSDHADVEWATNRESTSVVHYGTNPAQLDQVARGAASIKLHKVQVGGLKPQTPYYFNVESKDVSGMFRTSVSPAFPFFTPAEGQKAPYDAMQP
jgi:phosphodiesterase/alkaline phosphatase D-like protein